jgi:hypothetical protein
MKMKILKITVVQNSNAGDNIYLHTDLPSAIWPFDGAQTLSFSCARKTGGDYVNVHFPGIPFEIMGS